MLYTHNGCSFAIPDYIFFKNKKYLEKYVKL